MTVLLDAINVDAVGNFENGDGSERIILITADDFGGGTVTLELAETKVGSTPVTASDLSGAPQDVTDNRAFSIGPVPNGMKIRARLAGSSGADNLRVVMF